MGVEVEAEGDGPGLDSAVAKDSRAVSEAEGGLLEAKEKPLN